MIRRYGERVRSGQAYRRRPGVYAILIRDGRLLTTFQQSPVPEFQLPGGGIDRDENPIAALHREVMEETGWHMAGVRRIGAYRRFTFMPDYGFWAEKLCTVYLARPTLQIGPPSEAGHSAQWLYPAEALSLLGSAGDRALLAGVIG